MSKQRYGARNSGLPSVSRFQSGHMPSGVVPVSRAVNAGKVLDNSSGSDMDMGSDSDDEFSGARYSLETSPQDNKIPNGGAKYKDSLNGRMDDAGSHRNHLNSLEGRGGRFPAACRGFVFDEPSDSVTSSEVNSTLPRKTYVPDAYNSHIHLRPNEETANQDFSSVPVQSKKFYDDDIASAPPLTAAFQHVNQVAEKPVTSRYNVTARPTTSCGSAIGVEPNACKSMASGATEVSTPEPSIRTAAVSSHSLPSRYPTFHASGLGYWYGVISYDACVRLCLHSWAKGCMEAPVFLENECALLRDAFGLKHVLLQSEEELLRKESSELVSEGASVKTKKTSGKIKVQVRRVKMGLDPPTGCTFTSLKSTSVVKLESFHFRLSNVKSIVSSERKALRKAHVTPRVPIDGSFLQQSMTYIIGGTRRYMKEVPELIKIGVNAWRNSSSSYEVVQESYSCLLRLKSSPEEDAVRMQPGSGETHVFLPEGLGDDLIIEVHDSKGKYFGQVVVQVADIAEELGERLRSWPIYHEPEHELVGKMQLNLNYSTTPIENSNKCTSVAETIAYDCVLEAAMKLQQFQQRKLLLHGSWRWLVTEFASYYGVSDAYTKLRYLSYVMDVATPTADCLELVHDLLLPVVMKGKTKNTLSHQEVRILGEVSDQIEQIFSLVFENYKSLDESSSSGIVDVFRPAIGLPAPALTPALKLYKLLNDILSSEAQLKLCRYFQNAAKKRSRMHLAETDDLVSSNNDNILMDPVVLSTAYKKMKLLCINIKNEILTDIEIHERHILPSFIDLPNLSSSIYSTELHNRLRSFLVSCPPAGPSRPVVELVIATADFQRDLALWNISPVKGGVDAKELFHLYIIVWIQEKRLSMLESCKLDKAKWSSFHTPHSTTPFIDDIYDRLKQTLKEYDVIISRWPEYTFALESAIADVEKAVVESLEKQFAEVLSPLKESTMPMKLGLKYVQKFTKGNSTPYVTPNELGILLNSMKRMLDVLLPPIEEQLKLWGSCIPESGNVVPGESLSEVTVMIRTKFRAYLQAVMDKLVENTRLQRATNLKKIIQDAKENVIESNLQHRMQPLKDLLADTINQLHTILETQVFVIMCRGFWDRMGQDVLRFLEDRKENRSWYKASRVAVTVLDDAFVSQMQQLLGNALQEKDLEPPRSILEVRSMLCKDAVNHKENDYYY
ncbi:uncharacterized protein LOC111383866 [Olea europaea var. sylvestris]|uniref:uncharacterized protein LOC111383866 n=1 Tax=Olea europaea var. sylvestris TaxID=158386 RepID=UPI000C1D7E48|nr:uncharacterized protein LOC111383866 [Olea europaea var. sylvestris]